MTARNYDVILDFGTANNFFTSGAFEEGNVVIGSASAATGIIANVDATANTLKVKLSNSYVRFNPGENVHSNVATARIINTDFLYANSNSTVATVNEVNYAALNTTLEEARFAIRTAGDTFVSSVGEQEIYKYTLKNIFGQVIYLQIQSNPVHLVEVFN